MTYSIKVPEINVFKINITRQIYYTTSNPNSLHSCYYSLVNYYHIGSVVAASEGRSWTGDAAKSNMQDIADMTSLMSALSSNNACQDQMGNFYFSHFNPISCNFVLI